MFQHTPPLSRFVFQPCKQQITSYQWMILLFFGKNIVATLASQACYVIHESVSKVSLCFISQMIQTSLIHPPPHPTHTTTHTTTTTTTHTLTRKLMIWPRHCTASHNTRWCFCLLTPSFAFWLNLIECVKPTFLSKRFYSWKLCMRATWV